MPNHCKHSGIVYLIAGHTNRHVMHERMYRRNGRVLARKQVKVLLDRRCMFHLLSVYNFTAHGRPGERRAGCLISVLRYKLS